MFYANVNVRAFLPAPVSAYNNIIYYDILYSVYVYNILRSVSDLVPDCRRFDLTRPVYRTGVL